MTLVGKQKMKKNYKMTKYYVYSFKLSKISLAILFSVNSFADSPKKVEFNSSFLRSAIDASIYSEGNPVPEGIYSVELYVNNKWKGRVNSKFKNLEANTLVAQPCFDLKLISAIGLDTKYLAEDTITHLKDSETCVDINLLAKDIKADYDSSTQRLDIQSPQLYLLKNPRGYVSSDLWDYGIPATILQYDYNAWHTERINSPSFSTQYLGFRGGVNLGAWRLRYRGSLNWNDQAGWNYDNANTYLERPIIPWKSKLVLGESNTEGQVFNSIRFLGAMISSDDRMYADSQRGYAPVIKGIANTNALVSISQQGTRIYETTVPPGPFVINDLYPTGIGGDLLVSIKEADGNEHSFTVAYSSTSELLRPGVTRYTLMGGRYQNNTIDETPNIFLGTLRHGFNNIITGYAGTIISDNYNAIAGGVALNTPFGAISSDITHARSSLLNNQDSEGQSIRFSFSKILPVLNTNITLANYRYSSSGYYDINDAMLLRSENYGWYSSSINRKNRFQISASQNISDRYGNINFSASTQNYWNQSKSDTEYQIGYTNSFKNFNLNINASRYKDLVKDKWDSKIAIGVSLPIGKSPQNLYLNSNYIYETNHQGMQSTISGSAGENNQYSYNLYANIDKNDNSSTITTGGISGNWTSPFATIGGNFSTGNNYQQYSLNVAGGLIGYGNGIVATPIMGDTMAIVEADSAYGARLTSNTNIRLNKSGRAAVPYLTPYRQNTVELDPKGLSNDIGLLTTSQNIVPTAGAIVLMKYQTDVGHSILLNIDQKGKDLPFGSPLLDEAGNSVGYITQGSQGFARVKKSVGTLTVDLGSEKNQQCSLNYQISTEQISNQAIRYIDSECK